MEINEVETLLGTTFTEAKRPMYEARLASALDLINEECGGRFADPLTNVITLPEGAKMGAALLVKVMADNPGVASKTLADMSVSYMEGGPVRTARSYWKPYRRAKFF